MNIVVGSSERSRQSIAQLSEAIRRKHLAIAGKSGVGKTTAPAPSAETTS